MTMTPEQIYWNFHTGDSAPLTGTAEGMRNLVGAYHELVAGVIGLRSRQSGAWTGDAALAAAGRSDELVTSLRDSAELMDSCVRSHDAQETAFTGALHNVRLMPEVPEKPGPLDLAKEIVEHGPAAPFEKLADYRDAVLAYQEAAQHNLAVMDEYYWRTTDNMDIPADYPRPVLTEADTVTARPIDGMTARPLDGMTAEPVPAIGDPGGDPGGGSGGGPGGGGLPVAGVGTPGGGGGSGGTGPGGGGPDLPGVDVGGLDGPPGGDQPPPGGTSPSGDPGKYTIDTARYVPPPGEPPLVRLPPGGAGGPGDPGTVLGPGPRDTTPDRSREDRRGEREGTTYAARADVGADGGAGLGWPLAAGQDRTGGDAVSGGHSGRGAGVPGSAGAGGSPGTFGTSGARAGGPGGSGVGAPMSRQREEEDREHTRPEYLIEPDPEGLFGGAGSASSPVIGASWRPEYGEDTDD